MSVLGLRCSNKDFSYSVLSGGKNVPNLKKCITIDYPTGYSKPQRLKWFLQELEGLIKQNNIKIICYKGFEGRKKDRTFIERIEHETIIYLADINCNINATYKKVNKTIAKDLCGVGVSKLLKTKLNTSVIHNFNNYTDKQKDSIFAGWSLLK